TFGSALAAVQVVLSALQYLMSESVNQAGPGAFALTRPPGHHAGPAVCGGYCFFNNVAIAAKYLQSRVPNAKVVRSSISITTMGTGHKTCFTKIRPSCMFPSMRKGITLISPGRRKRLEMGLE
ncbi:hypothetical protein RSAG8_04397, partial [Rhizoctonia solani AG-8 WAC10335]